MRTSAKFIYILLRHHKNKPIPKNMKYIIFKVTLIKVKYIKVIAVFCVNEYFSDFGHVFKKKKLHLDFSKIDKVIIFLSNKK